ncbi:BTB/POZ domain-containing protein [Heracleum sosnowskyi]|uniref:BTB/POZ domain-containing protein n=1 Tax=Heracleum sosnowskyi TaxID=360622 RepID=A0AAD8HPN1_9APIA|nr:BTB/POZ domain-containing protein [Heracleum sosnowskyi]
MRGTKTQTVARFAQWTFETLSSNPKQSEAFKMGPWTWFISVEKDETMYVRLYPEPTPIAKEHPPLARFRIKVEAINVREENSGPHVSAIQERVLRTSEDFAWSADFAYYGRFTVEVEFFDLKIWTTNGDLPTSIWPSSYGMKSQASLSTLQSCSRMLNESIHADVSINTADGMVRAHKAILSASSPVFRSIFLDQCNEKESSTINIEDMSMDSCMALLSYMYGSINEEDFWKHRVTLLGAAHKYDMTDLKNSCEENLTKDINSENVLDRLQKAWHYELDNLKEACMVFLFDFKKIYEVRDEIDKFFEQADRELLIKMFHQGLGAWKVA